MKIVNILIFLIVLLVFNTTQALSQQNNKDVEIGIIEHLNSYIPDNILLVNEKSDTVDFKKVINMPTVVCFVYFDCPMLCTPLMNGLAQVIDKTDLKIGKDYQVVTIGFDVEEPLSLAIDKKNVYIESMQTKEAANGWKFFVSDSANIAKATEAFGFRFKKAGNIFLHSATLIFVSPEGKITRYLNGTYFLPFEFKMGIIEASKGKAGPTINKVLQFCYGYDNQAKKYVLDVTKVAGTIILMLLFITFLVLILKPRHKVKNA